jgi:hypothetical protein
MGQEISSPVSVVDLFPTLLDLLDFSSTTYWGDGISMFSNSSGRLIYFSTHYHDDILGLRDGNFKFIYRPKQGKEELYDLKEDHKESRNLTNKYQERSGFYRRSVVDWAAYTRSRQIRKFNIDPTAGVLSLIDLPILFISQDYGSLAFNQTIEGRNFQIAGKKWDEKGFGTHANSIIVFDVSKFQGYTFKTRFGRDQEASKGRVIAQIWMDGQVVYESKELTSEDTPIEISIPITGNKLSLVSLETHDGGSGDHVDWLEPILVK